MPPLRLFRVNTVVNYSRSNVRLAIQPFVTFLNLFLAINAHSITFGKPPLPPADPLCDARQATELEGCGIKDQSFVCDPDLVLTQEDETTFKIFESLESETRTRLQTDCERKGLTVGVAISKTKITPEAEQAATAEAVIMDMTGMSTTTIVTMNLSTKIAKKKKTTRSIRKTNTTSFHTYLCHQLTVANPCFVAGGLTLTQLLSHHVNNDNRFAVSLCEAGTNAFRQKRYLDGLLEMLEEQRQIHLDAKLFSAIETCRSLAALPASSPITETTPSTSAFTTPKLTNHTTNKTDPSNLTPADPRALLSATLTKCRTRRATF
uniref:Uncharacterized protein n=1 Tax=Ditylenchus dipsaci TaxID=166011 RepID=A0A915E085_9BILA